MNNHRHQALENALASRILIMDGAMGTMLQEHNPTPADFGGEALENCNENLCRTRPEWILDIHRAYLEAGADIIETNSFQGSPIVLAEFGLEDKAHELNVAGGATRAPGGRRVLDYIKTAVCRRVHGAHHEIDHAARRRHLPATESTATIMQAKALVEGGVDLLLLETGFDTRNIKAGLSRSEHWSASWASKSRSWSPGPSSAGARCWPASRRRLLRLRLARESSRHRSELRHRPGPDDGPYPHAREYGVDAHLVLSRTPGLPNEEDKYLETPESLAAQLEKFVEHGWLNIVGGCCGTTPAHIRAIAQMADGRAPHVVNRATRIAPTTPASIWSKPKTATAR